MVRPLGSSEADGGGVEGRVGGAVAPARGGEVGDLGGEGEARRAQLLGVGGTVEHDVEEARCAVLGDVEAESASAWARSRVGVATRTSEDGRRCPRASIRVSEIRFGAPRAAGEPAGLHGERRGADAKPSASSSLPR